MGNQDENLSDQEFYENLVEYYLVNNKDMVDFFPKEV